jgi:hypothetical protein
MTEPTFDVLDALGGLARLTARTPTLDGNVPIRVAQGCQPMLEGNAFGFQIELTRPLTVRARLGRLLVCWPDGVAADVGRRCRAAAPRLTASGILARGGPWHEALGGRAAWTSGSHARLWTGLFVRPERGVWLRVSSCANRRNRMIAVNETWIRDADRFVPLVVDVALVGTRGPITLAGEIATLAAFAPGASIRKCPLSDAMEVGCAHAAFYDASYFQTKKARIDAKYRRLLKRTPVSPVAGAARACCRVVVAGPADFEVAEELRVLGPDTTRAGRARAGVASVMFRNAISFRAMFDGYTLTLERDDRALAVGAEAVERAFAGAYGDEFVREHRGALYYLTKYFTPHPVGEPHFFVKPWAFTVTPPGWSTLVEGIPGAGYDVLRGVVATDVYHATPAVFLLHDTGRWIDVPRGTALVRAIPFPRSLARRAFHQEVLA